MSASIFDMFMYPDIVKQTHNYEFLFGKVISLISSLLVLISDITINVRYAAKRPNNINIENTTKILDFIEKLSRLSGNL